MDKSRPWLLVLAAAFLALPLPARDFYVTPTGTSSGDGTMENPWSLAKALSHPGSVKPGDTIWLRGGTYTGHFGSSLRGEPSKPIIVRQYPGERATIDGYNIEGDSALRVGGAYTWYWGFEIMNSGPQRAPLPSGESAKRGNGVNLLGDGSKLINVVVHDAGQGVLTTAAAPDAEVYGCLFYYNGNDGTDRGHGHGIYVQNETGVKRVVDNIIFNQFGWGIHAYTESGQLNNLHFEGNTSFNNGLLSQVSGARPNFLIGANGSAAESPEASAKVARKTFLVSNYSYFAGTAGVGANLGYSKGIASPTLVDNYIVGGRALALINAFEPIHMTGNTFYGTVSGFESSEFPGNAFLTTRPTGAKVFVRPNQYEPGRANITIFNWDRVGMVNVSLKGVLAAGTRYEVRNAQNFFGPPILSGTYDGTSSLQLPMTGLTAATPVGRTSPPPETGPDFQVFVVIPKPPVSNAKPPVAAFSFGPRSPAEGEAVAFGDLSTGTSTTRSWDFGDPASGENSVSSAATPSHTYAETGTYTIRLTVASEGGTSTRTRNVTVTASPGSRAATLPVAGHIVGATGTTFVTDVAVENPTAQAVSATLVFSPSGGEAPLEAPLSLAPGEARLLADVVDSEFGANNALGSLRVETEGSPPAALRVAGRTYVRNVGSTLGLGTIGLTSAETATGDRYLSNLAISDDYRTNIGAVNTSGADQAFTLQLLDGHGNVLGRSHLTLAPGQQRQWSLAQLFPAATGTGLTARIVPNGGGLAPLTYAAVTDNGSSDPTYYSALGPAPVQYVPGIASVTGVGDAFFRSEVSIANSGRSAAMVKLTFLEHDRNNTSAPTATVILGPYETLHADDALQTLFGVTDTYGALLVESDVSPGVTVFERILTDATETEGTVGQQTDAVSAENLAPRGSLLGIRQDEDFRTNIGFLNPGGANATVTLTLIRSPATELGTAEVGVPPRGYVQRNLAALFPGVALAPGELLSIGFDASDQPVIAFASVIDNVSQDPTFYPAQP